MIYRRESAFTNVTKQTLDTNLVYKEDCTPVKRVTKQQNMSRTRTAEYRSKSMLLPYHVMLRSKQTHGRLGTLIISLSRIELRSIRDNIWIFTTIFESAQGFPHPVHIDKCSEAQFKSGVHLGCKKTWPSGTSDFSTRTWNEQPADKIILLLGKRRWDGGRGECRMGQLA